MKSFNVKAIRNKANGQINFSLPKSKIENKTFKKSLSNIKSLRIKIEDWSE
jgi:hypothetical protein